MASPLPRPYTIAAVVLAGCAMLGKPAAALPPLAGHHAVYTLALKTGADQGAIGASGSMVFDLNDTCAGWTTAQHMIIDLTDHDGQEQHMVSDYATLESHDGSRLDFHSRQTTNGHATAKVDGAAQLEHSGGRGFADYTSPEAKHVLLPEGTLLPTAHTTALLVAADAGHKFLSAPLFDGTGESGAEDSFVTIGEHFKAAPSTYPSLTALPATHVRVAFFDRTTAAETPDFEVAMRYYTNGVASDLEMNFGDFTMLGRLDHFDPKPPSHC